MFFFNWRRVRSPVCGAYSRATAEPAATPNPKAIQIPFALIQSSPGAKYALYETQGTTDWLRRNVTGITPVFQSRLANSRALTNTRVNMAAVRRPVLVLRSEGW